MDHLEPFRQAVRAAKLTPPPPPWRQITVAPVGGLTEVGFTDDSESLCVLSSQGRGIFNCTTGKRVARDRDDDRKDWYGRDDLIAKGFGPLEGKEIRLSGLWGGGLPTYTKDGWLVERVTLNWPDEHLLLFAPDRSNRYGPTAKFSVLERPITEIRAFGFSYSGRSLIIATSSDVTIFGR